MPTPTDPLARRGLRYNMVMQQLFIKRRLGGFQTIKIYPGHRYVALAIRPETDSRKTITTDQFLEDLAMDTGTHSVRVWRDRAALIYEFESPEMYWRFFKASDIPAGFIGMAGNRQRIDLDFSESMPHAGVFGTSGSGKTTTIKMAVYALARRYSPERIQFAISDPNHHFAGFGNLAHLAAPVAVSREDNEALVRYVYSQFRQRRDSDIKNAPRLVLVFDEAAEVIPEPARRAQDEITKMVSELARLGRTFKVNLLLGTQKPGETRFPGIFGQITNRYLGKVDSAATSANVTGHAQMAAHKLTGKGDFLHILSNGEGLRFQAGEVTQADLDRLPRAEAKPMPAVKPEIVEYPDVLGNEPGRPALKIEPDILAKYYRVWPHLPSVRQAHADWGVSQRHHQMHRDFITQFMGYVEEAHE